MEPARRRSFGQPRQGGARRGELLDAEYYDVLAGDAWIESKLSAGGSASARVAEQLAAARTALAELAG